MARPEPDLVELRRAVAEVAAAEAPELRVLEPRGPFHPRALAILPGAFNPPTLAHAALARAAIDQGFDAVLFSLATRTIDKEEPDGLPLDERLHLLRLLAAADRRLGVVVQNRGLYAEQAEAVRRALASVEDLAFVVGMDKVPQIFDRRYYRDPERSLAALFTQARLLVAARGDLDRSALTRLLDSEPGRTYRQRIGWIDLEPAWRELSATRVRERLARGELPREWLPAEVARFLEGRAGLFRARGR